jgi:SAM-dependent methyltransferase
MEYFIRRKDRAGGVVSLGPVTKPPTSDQLDLADRVARQEWIERTKRNFRMQYRLAVSTLIPWLEKHHALPTRPSVCEIGCGEGGVLLAFVERGAEHALGTDIMGLLLEQVSAPIAEGLGMKVDYTGHDVINDDIAEDWRERFDVVLLRDVIEHLDDPAVALQNIARIMKPGGVIVITFPPYTSAFGGHQQLLGTTAGNIPFVHLLPASMFERMIARGDVMNADEVRRLHRIRCSADGIKSAAAAAGITLVDERYFGLRPVFRHKYNMAIPTLEITSLKGLGIVRALAMEAAFIFRKPV